MIRRRKLIGVFLTRWTRCVAFSSTEMSLLRIGSYQVRFESVDGIDVTTPFIPYARDFVR
jgi:hypothetical protein